MGLRAGMIAVLLSVGLGAGDAQAQSGQLACGATVTTSITLTADVSCPMFQSPGLVIGADNITVDLSGHSITTPPLVGGGSAIGVLDFSHSGVVIRNGAVSGFGTGLLLAGASNTQLTDLDVSGANNGIALYGGGGDSVTGGNIIGRASSIAVHGSGGARIANNTVTGSGTGITVDSDHAVVSNNNATQTSDWGIVVSGSSNVIGPGNAAGNALYGLEVQSGPNNVVFDNWVLNNSSDGLRVDAGATNTAVFANVATGNGTGGSGDGIDVASPGTWIINNLAYANKDYGIAAVPGVFASGNRAGLNGNPAQCLNVSCS